MTKEVAVPRVSELLCELNSYDGPVSEYLTKLLNVKRIAVEAAGAALIKISDDGAVGLLSSSPTFENGVAPEWFKVALSFKKEITTLQSSTVKVIDEKSRGFISTLVFLPVNFGEEVTGVEIFYVVARDLADINRRVQQLEILAPYYDFYEGRLRFKEFQGRTERLYEAFDVIIKLNNCESYLGALMTLTNELAARWSCSRVSCSAVKGKQLRMKAISNSNKFNRKMDVIRDLEEVMEECADQNLEICFPQSGDGINVCRRAQAFSNNHGPLSILSVPFRIEGEVVAVAVFERGDENPFTLDEIESLRLIADLFSPFLEGLRKQDRWIGERIIDGVRSSFSGIIGSKHTVLKLFIILVIAAAWFFSWFYTTYHVESSFAFESKSIRVISAPYSGEVSRVFVKNGQAVKANDSLFQLDTTELRLQLNNLHAKRVQVAKKIAVALREGKPAEEQIARAEAQGIDTEIELIQYSLKRSNVRATMSGTIVGDDLKKRELSVVELGKVVLTIVEPDNLEAMLYVPEDQIADVKLSMKGELAAAGYPDRKILFIVNEIETVARVIDQKNVYRVRAEIEKDEKHSWIRPGMEGVARINSGDRLAIWVWTRKAVNWLRMRLWF